MIRVEVAGTTSAPVVISTPAADAPSAPSNIVATEQPDGSVKVEWDRSASNLSGQTIVLFDATTQEKTEIAVPAFNTYHQLSALTPGHYYQISMRSSRYGVDSPASRVVCF